MINFFKQNKYRFLLFLTVFGPATITAMSDNDAGGVATYSIAGAKLGYPILFALLIMTLLLAITQETGIRLSIVTRRGLGDLIRETFGIKVALFIFISLFIANMGTIIVDLAAVKTTSSMLHLPAIPTIIFVLVLCFLFIIRGSYKTSQSIFLLSSLFYLSYLFSAFKANPNWNLAFSNLIFPNGVGFTKAYLKDYLLIGMGVLGTTITPWGQFFISSFSFDKKIEIAKLKYSQIEAYIGAFLTNFFSFFMIVATAATLFAHKIILTSGEQAAMAIKPFAGEFASALFAFGILNAGFMGVCIVSLSTSYVFSEFFGVTGSLDSPIKKSRGFYTMFIVQLIIAAIVVLFSSISLFQLAIVTQAINAMTLPLVFYYLLKLTNNPEIMGNYTNNKFQFYFIAISAILIFLASIFTILTAIGIIH